MSNRKENQISQSDPKSNLQSNDNNSFFKWFSRREREAGGEGGRGLSRPNVWNNNQNPTDIVVRSDGHLISFLSPFRHLFFSSSSSCSSHKKKESSQKKLNKQKPTHFHSFFSSFLLLFSCSFSFSFFFFLLGFVGFYFISFFCFVYAKYEERTGQNRTKKQRGKDNQKWNELLWKNEKRQLKTNKQRKSQKISNQKTVKHVVIIIKFSNRNPTNNATNERKLKQSERKEMKDGRKKAGKKGGRKEKE